MGRFCISRGFVWIGPPENGFIEHFSKKTGHRLFGFSPNDIHMVFLALDGLLSGGGTAVGGVFHFAVVGWGWRDSCGHGMDKVGMMGIIAWGGESIIINE